MTAVEITDRVLWAAAEAVTTTFQDLPVHPVTVQDQDALSDDELVRITERYWASGFAVLDVGAGRVSSRTPLALAKAMSLGEAFVPPLYSRHGRVGPSVSRISAAVNAGTDDSDHPSFGSRAGQRLHCDGTLQEIGWVKASLLVCERPAFEGGNTTLFNSSAAFAELATEDMPAALALTVPGTMVRQANINGSTEINSGPAFSVRDGQLVCRYCLTETDRWEVPAEVSANDLWRGVEALARVARPGSPHYTEITLRAGQAIVFDNTRISHGRTPYRDSPDRVRCLYRSLHLAHPTPRRGKAVPPPPPVDPELAPRLAEILQSLTTLTPKLVTTRRAMTAASSLSDEALSRNGAFEIGEIRVPGPLGAPDVPLLVCRPTATPGPHAVIYNAHGGGMVAGSNRTIELADELDRAEELQLAVVAAEYRLAPENPHPAPVEDCYAGLCWVAQYGATVGLDPERIVVSGNSAGGALAAALALLARDRAGPRLLGQMLQCPMLDDRVTTPSALQLEDSALWNGHSNRAGWTALLGEQRGTDAVSPYAAPYHATDLSELPPMLIDVGAVESLRDEGIDYAQRVWQAGGQAELHVWSGAFHSFDHWVPDANVSQAAKRARVSWLTRLLETS